MQSPPALHGLGTHLKVALGQYFKRIWHLIGIGCVTLLASAVVGAGFWAAAHFGSRLVPQHRLLVTAAAACLGALALVWLINWGATAAVIAVVDRRSSVGACLSDACGKVLSTIWISLLLGFVMTGAAFLIVPWALFSVWFYFAPFVLADGGSRGMGALLESREYVRGHWFAVFFRIVFIWGLYGLLLLVPLAGPVLALAFLPLVLFYNGVLYDNLKGLRGGTRFYPRSGSKACILATSTAGYILPLLLLALMGPMLWQVLERQMPLGDPRPSTRTIKIAPVPVAVPVDRARVHSSAGLSAPRWSASPEALPPAGSDDVPAHPLVAVNFDILPKLWPEEGAPALQTAGEAIDRPLRVAPTNGVYYYGRGSRRNGGG